MSLQDSADKLADEIYALVKKENRKQQSKDGIKAVTEAGYNIKDDARELKKLYLA